MTHEDLNRELRALRETMVDALNRRDLDEILRHLEPDIIFTPLNNEVCHGAQAVRDYFHKQMVGPDRIVEDLQLEMTADEKRIFYDENLAVISGNSVGLYKLTSGLQIEVKWRWTATLARRDKQWWISAFHSSANLFDNPLLTKTKKAVVWAGVGGLAAGLVVGFLLGRR